MFVCQLHCTKEIIMVFTFTQLYGLYPLDYSLGLAVLLLKLMKLKEELLLQLKLILQVIQTFHHCLQQF